MDSEAHTKGTYMATFSSRLACLTEDSATNNTVLQSAKNLLAVPVMCLTLATLKKSIISLLAIAKVKESDVVMDMLASRVGDYSDTALLI